MATIPTENYLIAIQTLHDEGIRCIPARVAERMEVSAPTVTEALKRMERDGYVEYSSSREIDLTRKGRDLALSLMQRHRIVERWLTDVLGLDWASAHEEAHKLEHAISDVVAERIWQSMGCPDSCPHGNPIVDTDPSLPARVRLSDVEKGSVVVLHRISELAEDNRELMIYLQSEGFNPGSRIDVADRGPTGSLFSITLNGKKTAVSADIAAFLWVRPLAQTA